MVKLNIKGMKNILLTLDYELFGNGKGDVFKHIIEPTDILLALADKYRAKYTFFFEIVEFWKLKEEWNKGNRMGYDRNPLDAMVHQLQKAVKKGHDVQLHIHPQWVDAKWKETKWYVNLDEWKLGTYKRNGEESLVNLLLKGKHALEEMIRPVAPDYQCIALRAGGYNAMPSEELVKAMRQVGLYIDSSVYPGGFEESNLSVYDYRNVPNDIGRWFVDEQLEYVSDKKTDVVEIPIVSKSIKRWRKYASLDRILTIIDNLKGAKEVYEEKVSGAGSRKCSELQKLQFLLQNECQTWDFCLLSPSVHRSFLRMIGNMKNRDCFVLVGHPKSYCGKRGMNYLFKKLSRKGYCFTTISRVYNNKIK